MLSWLRRLGFWVALALSSLFCWVLSWISQRKSEKEALPLSSLRGKAEAIRTACQAETQAISSRLNQFSERINSTGQIPDEKARLQALADIANERKHGVGNDPVE